MGAMASQITSSTIVYPTVYSTVDQRKHQRSASLAFGRGIHRWQVTGEYPAQRASIAENVSIWWRHHWASTKAGQGTFYFVVVRVDLCYVFAIFARDACWDYRNHMIFPQPYEWSWNTWAKSPCEITTKHNKSLAMCISIEMQRISKNYYLQQQHKVLRLNHSYSSFTMYYHRQLWEWDTKSQQITSQIPSGINTSDASNSKHPSLAATFILEATLGCSVYINIWVKFIFLEPFRCNLSFCIHHMQHWRVLFFSIWYRYSDLYCYFYLSNESIRVTNPTSDICSHNTNTNKYCSCGNWISLKKVMNEPAVIFKWWGD